MWLLNALATWWRRPRPATVWHLIDADGGRHAVFVDFYRRSA
jgi:hypothetical protein